MPSRDIVIEFAGQISDIAFESRLVRYYVRTRKSRGTVIFDLRSITWCDLLSLSSLTLWILELVSLGVETKVFAPSTQAKDMQRFFQVYRFVSKLDDEHVPHDFPSLVVPHVDTLWTAPALPLTFFTETKLRDLLNDLQSPDRLKVVLSGMADANIVKSGAIRDVVIAELGSNFFNHAEGRFAHLLMTTSGIVSDDRLSARVTAQVLTAPKSEWSFFQALRGQPYLTLVFSDMGPGIPDKIRNAYRDDDIVSPKKSEPTNKDLLQYAFLYHSTGRPQAERIGQIRDVISNAMPHPTGLYQLRKIVRDYRGMLVLRSGKARLVEDFLSETNPKTHLEDVSDFGGTQYKLYFPYYTPESRTAYSPSSLPTQSHSELACVQLAAALPLERPANNQEAATALSDLFAAVERVRYEAIRSGNNLVIDAKGVDLLPSNALFYLQLELMRRQEPPQYSIVVNGPSSLPDLLGDTAASDPSARPILIFDQNWMPRAVGLRQEEESLFETLIRDIKSATAEARQFAMKHPEWFQYHRAGDVFEFRFTESSLKGALRHAYSLRLAAALTDPSEEFFSSDAKVLLPSKSYCHGYFDIAKFAGSHRFKNMLQAWITYGIEKFAPSYVVTIGATAADLISKHDFEAVGVPKILHLPTPIASNQLFAVSNAIPSNSSVVIVTDVIGTSNTLKFVLRQLRRARIVVTLAVVDATHQDEHALLFEGQTFAIQAIVKQKITFHPELPAGWDYDDISQVDPETHALILHQRHSVRSGEGSARLAPLWTESQATSPPGGQPTYSLRTNPFLEEAVIPAAAILEGHYVTANAHMIYLFNIPALIKSFGDRIIDLIYCDVDKYLSSMPTRPNISQIAYPEYNLGLADLGNALSAQFPSSSPVPISRHILDRRLSSAIPFGPVVLILDDAMYSGNTIFEMLDLVESAGVKHVLIYTILRRGSLNLTNRIRKIRKYGQARVAVREVASIEMPMFKRSDCPACALSKVLEDINMQLNKGSALKRALMQDLIALAERETDIAYGEPGIPQAVHRPQLQQTAERIRLRWMLEIGTEPIEMGVRNLLAQVVRNYERDPNTTLRFFEVLARERIVFLSNVESRNKIFYSTFSDDIGPAAVYFAGRLDSLSDSEAEGVLGVFAAFEPITFLKRLPDLLSTYSANERLCWLLLRECILTPEIRGLPLLVIRALTEGRSMISPDRLEIIDDALKLWGELNENKRIAPPPLDEYKRLTAPAVHNLGIETKKLVVDITQGSSDLAADWPRVCGALTNFAADLSRFRRGLSKYADTEALWTRTQELNSRLRSLRETIGADGVELKELDEATKKLLATNLERTILLIDSMTEPYGIRTLLEEYRINILTGSLDQAIVAHSDELNKRGVELNKVIPKCAPLAFGLNFHLYVVFGNILANVVKSGAKNLLVCVEVHPEEQCVKVAFLDNGRGVEANVAFHDGLQSVQDTTTAFGGAFELRAPSLKDPEAYHAYSTLALVTLQFLPEYRRP
jgi:adenine/guanine phosphoribosyltransferase-like PRPP-binding protein